MGRRDRAERKEGLEWRDFRRGGTLGEEGQDTETIWGDSDRRGGQGND